MENTGLLCVSEFAAITGTTVQTLYHYDRIGLFRPAVRGENNYRYYSPRQLALCNTIRLLHNLGVPLAKIKQLKNTRTPEMIMELLHNQIRSIQESRARLDQVQNLIVTMLRSIQSGLEAEEGEISIRFLPAERIFLGEPNRYGEGVTDYDALHEFYRTMRKKYDFSECDMSYPVWGIFSRDRILKRDWVYPDRYYFYNPAGESQRPAAFYAIGYARSSYGQCAALYGRILDYIDKNGFEICGDAYEEYPLNEIGVADDTNYLVRVMITVRKAE